MKLQSRFLKSVVSSASDARIAPPYTRGARRSAALLRRKGRFETLRQA